MMLLCSILAAGLTLVLGVVAAHQHSPAIALAALCTLALAVGLVVIGWDR